jgi:capsular polysaccharide biosynthesis protein
MELRTYYKILLRWWWLALIPAIIIGLIGIVTFRRPTTTYSTKIRFSASTPPAFESAPGFDPTYYSWLTSEYIVGSLSDWTKTTSFAQAVSDELSKQGKNISAATIQSSLASDYVRSQLTLYIHGATADDVSAIANAAITVLQTRNASVFPQLGKNNAVVTPLDVPSISSSSVGLRDSLDLPIRLLLGVAVGVACAFLAHYFDPFVRERKDVEVLGLNVLVEIPKN